MKTTEEIKAAVLKECERLCPKGTKEHVRCDGFSLEWIDWGDVMEGGLRLYGVADWMYIEPNMSDYVALHAYRLLNIEARELEERLKFTIGKLDEETWERQAAERKVMELEGRAQGLVDACEDVVLWTDSQSHHDKCRQALNQWKGGGK